MMCVPVNSPILLLVEGRFMRCLLDPRALPGFDRMAAVALRAVLPEMPVILVMAVPALGRRLHRTRGLVMTIGTFQLLVRAEERKMRLLGVVETPQLPSVRRVTALAFLAESALVHVVVRMTLV